MSIEDKVGQLFVLHVYGEQAEAVSAADAAANQAYVGVPTPAEAVAKFRPGGVIYFAWANNTKNPQQIARLSNGIQRAAAATPSGVPVMVSVDQEHGIVARIDKPATQFPGAMALAAGRSTVNAVAAGAVAGAELRAMGVQQDYAPVADVNVNPANPVIGVRSFGSDPTLAATLTAAQVVGYQSAGESATAKHFPGHGDTATDSHTGLPVITHTRAELDRIDLPPFRAAIRAGVDSIMTAHIVVPALDPSGDPATLSRPILTGVLRERLGFKGVVVTDSLDMAGVRQKYGDDRVPVLALKAGADVLLNPPVPQAAYDGVLAAVRSGEVSEQRLDQSVRRILELKARRGLVAAPYVDEGRVARVVGTRLNEAVAQRVADASVTLLKDAADVLPVRPGRSLLVTGYDSGGSVAGVAARITARGVAADALGAGTSPTQAQVDAAAAAARTHDVTVVLTSNASTSPRQQALVTALQATGKPVVQVALRNPYDIAAFPAVPTALLTYSSKDVSLDALARVLTGSLQPKGRLPVAIPAANGSTLFDYGSGIRSTR
ncbi:glycoside hydrolase family 3 protein [Motilibacter sp. E257]|uniref:beta-N-acetylhexosaminidase n=2 Tax=Motilibacter deserti TaxID=2714956 RepID=A0ABX0GPG2_9ACTN|nr:glycoside hydrolase family 3 protein [Motilibacter deserti]NHC12733.1 glycoside hydrolase family 3 protein [Motilibacter deserti]